MSSVNAGAAMLLLAALQPVGVAAQGVDFAVVGDHAERLGQPPTGKRVRAVTLVDDGQGRPHPRVGQVGIIGEQLRREEHALVDDRAAGHRRHVEVVGRRAERLGHAAFDPLADDVKPPLQLFVFPPLAADKRLPNDRLGRSRQLAQAAVLGGHVAPAEHLQTRLRRPIRRKSVRSGGGAASSRGRNNIATPYCFGSGSWKPNSGRHGAKEPVGNLQQDAGAVAGRFVGPGRPAVHEVQQHLLAVLDDGVVAASRDVHDGPDPARIVFPLRIVQTLGLWWGGFHVVTVLSVFIYGLAISPPRPAAGNELPCPTIIVSLVSLMSIDC